MRRAAKVDANQEAIVKRLREIGAQVEVIGKPVDLLVGYRGRTELVEVKSPRPTSEGGSHGITKDQAEFIAKWPANVHIVRSPDEAVAAIIGRDALK